MPPNSDDLRYAGLEHDLCSTCKSQPLACGCQQDEDRWGRTWGRIEFHLEGLVAEGSYGSDPDIDALQLYIAIRTILKAPSSLQSLQLYTRGHAFWSAPHLRRLLDWSDRLSMRSFPGHDHVDKALESWVDDVGVPLAAIKYTEALTRDIMVLECGFSGLVALFCRIETGWSEDPNELESVASALSHSLKQAVKLEQLSLVFREWALDDDCGSYTYFDHRFDPQTKLYSKLW